MTEKYKDVIYFHCDKNKTTSNAIDCEQSLFSAKIRGEERKTSKRASVTSEWRVLAASPLAARTSRSQSRSHVLLFCVLPHRFSRKRETARSLQTRKNDYLFTTISIVFSSQTLDLEYLYNFRKKAYRLFDILSQIKYFYNLYLSKVKATFKIHFEKVAKQYQHNNNNNKKKNKSRHHSIHPTTQILNRPGIF